MFSSLILGCGNFGGIGSAPAFYGMGETEAQAIALMDRAWDAGINAFDTADAYGGGRRVMYARGAMTAAVSGRTVGRDATNAGAARLGAGRGCRGVPVDRLVRGRLQPA